MDFNRIKNLLCYDWALNKKKFMLTMSTVGIIYVACVMLYLVTRSIAPLPEGKSLPFLASVFISNFFGYASYAMIFVVTVVLHNKFTDARTSTSYITLPGSSAEKFVVLLCDYLFGWLSVWGLYLVCHCLTMGLCAVVMPEYDWFVNPIKMLYPNEDLNDYTTGFMAGISGQDVSDVPNLEHLPGAMGDVLRRYFSTAVWFAWCVTLVQFFYYLVLNMCFRKNGQMKSLAVYVGTTMVLVIAFVVCVVVHIISVKEQVSSPDKDAVIFDILIRYIDIIIWVFRLSPIALVGMMGILYRQIVKKQAC